MPLNRLMKETVELLTSYRSEWPDIASEAEIYNNALFLKLILSGFPLPMIRSEGKRDKGLKVKRKALRIAFMKFYFT